MHSWKALQILLEKPCASDENNGERQTLSVNGNFSLVLLFLGKNRKWKTGVIVDSKKEKKKHFTIVVHKTFCFVLFLLVLFGLKI
jgi:hypothetical protein